MGSGFDAYSHLLHCDVCDGPYTLRGQGRFACSTHNDTRACDNGHTITRIAVEERVVDGLKDRLMAPNMVDEAIRGYVEETNRLNHERRAAQGAAVATLAKIARAKADIVDAIENGRYSETLMDRLLHLEANEKTMKAAMAEMPADTPDIHPNIAGIYAKKVERLAEALNLPEDRDEAAEAIRSLIERVTLTPGAKRGEVNIMLHGEFGAILQWLGASAGRRNDDSPTAGAAGLGVSSKMVAGTRFHLNLQSDVKQQFADALPCPSRFPGLFGAMA
ncbi:zinc ribbon domain-containing protein [Novosphingobium sp. Leaf2]|uniref:zinc ribbon domain-containing protein n=1 Tax=Novosphingobium sp. Leaf2 TaxID=1735670 RepID=UPI00070172AF|nr:zinc ribbon domain-containing protein [Novosphingobium sp. Leaf2]KQM18219.1 hypothetical protein ASE49_08275 [Novosphingobium sp. Leaf2]